MYKNDFCWDRGGSLFKIRFDIKNWFCMDKGKGIPRFATPTRTPAHDWTVVVSNSVSKEFGVNWSQSQSILLAKTLAKMDVVS